MHAEKICMLLKVERIRGLGAVTTTEVPGLVRSRSSLHSVHALQVVAAAVVLNDEGKKMQNIGETGWRVPGLQSVQCAPHEAPRVQRAGACMPAALQSH